MTDRERQSVHPILLCFRIVALLGVIAAFLSISLDYFAHERAVKLAHGEYYHAWNRLPQELFWVLGPWVLVALMQASSLRNKSLFMDIARLVSFGPVYFALYFAWSYEIQMWWSLGTPPNGEGIPSGDFDIPLTVAVSYPLCFLTGLMFSIYKWQSRDRSPARGSP